MAIGLGAGPPGRVMEQLTNHAIWFNYNEAQIREVIANYVNQEGTTGHYGGEAGQAEQELRMYAHNQGVWLSDQSLKSWLRNIVAVHQTTNDYKAYIQKQAELAFPNLADKIKSGVTVKDLASPYIQSMAQTLEVDDQSIGLDDQTIRKALQSTGPDGKFESKPLWQFEQDLKKDPRWMQTNNARNSLVGTAQNVLKDWGIYF
jgi:hypothetical protein